MSDALEVRTIIIYYSRPICFNVYRKYSKKVLDEIDQR